MKTIFHQITLILLLGCSVWLPAGCSDFLREKPISSVDLDEYVADSTALVSMLVGTYSRLQGLYGAASIPIGEVGTDISRSTKGSNVNAGPVESYTVTPSSPAVRDYWRSSFLLIRDANIVISKAEELYQQNRLGSAGKVNMESEARFLRAFGYFRLMQTYGGVPIIKHRIVEIGKEEFSYPRASIKEVFDFIESELLYCINSGGISTSKNGGRVNIWAVKAALARLYLYAGSSKHRDEVGTPLGGRRGDNRAAIPGGATNLIPGYSQLDYSYAELYQKAHDLLKDIKDNGGFKVTTNFYDPFMPSRKNTNTESIWEVQFSSVIGYGAGWSKLFGVRSDNNVSTYSAVVGSQIVQPALSFWKYYRRGDVRRNLNIAAWALKVGTNESITGQTSLLTNTSEVTIGSDSYTLKADLDAESDTILFAAFSNTTLNNQIGTQKYGWGMGSDPFEWWYERMAYSSSDCPNNVVVFRYADILLMFAETEMLLNGASPAQPKAMGYATQAAVDAINELYPRAMGHKTYTEIRDTLKAQFELDTAATRKAYTTANNTYTKNPSTTNRKNMLSRRVEWNDARMRLSKVDDLVIKPFELANLTYEDIIDERGRELCFELNRWFDLQRLGWLKYKVYQRRQSFSDFPIPNIEEPKHYLYPLPLTDIDLSYNDDFRTNNPGYH